MRHDFKSGRKLKTIPWSSIITPKCVVGDKVWVTFYGENLFEVSAITHKISIHDNGYKLIIICEFGYELYSTGRMETVSEENVLTTYKEMVEYREKMIKYREMQQIKDDIERKAFTADKIAESLKILQENGYVCLSPE